MKKRNSKAICISFMSLGLLLSFGQAFALWAVTDNADSVNFAITLSNDNRATISFEDPDGNAIYSESVLKGEAVANVPTNPTKAGYVFDGWTTDKSTYNVTSDVIGTTTYTSDVTYVARFASYGYKLGASGTAQHISNNRAYADRVQVAASTSVTFGTYIYGKSSLEKTTSASSTEFSKAGYYAFTCNGEGTNWDSTKSNNRSNWKVERYYELTIPSSLMTSYGLFGHFFNNGDTVRQTEPMTNHLINTEGNFKKYFAYAQYDLTNVIFGLLDSNGTAVNSNWDNVSYQTPTKAMAGNDYQYEVGMKTIKVYWPTNASGDVYMLGSYSSWDKTAATKMNWTNGDIWEKTFFDFVGASYSYKFGRSYNDNFSYTEWEYDSGSDRALTIESGVNIETKTKGNPNA